MRVQPNTTLFKVLILFCFALTSAQSSAQETSASYFVLEDTTRSAGFYDIQSSYNRGLFTPLAKPSIRYDVTRSVIWVALELENKTKGEELFLELTAPYLHYVDFYQPDHGSSSSYTITHTGSLREFQSRPVSANHFYFPLREGGGLCFIRIEGGHFLNTNLKIVDHKQLVGDASMITLFLSFYFGIIFIIVIGMLLYVIQTREYFYLYYLAYIVSISTINLTEKGFYLQYLWPKHPELNYYFPVLPFVVSFFLMLFLKQIFRIDKAARVLYFLNFWLVTILSLLPTIVFLLQGNYGSAFLIAQLHGIASCALMLTITIVCYLRNKELRPFMKLIIMGISCFCLGVICYLLMQNEVLPNSFFSENAIVIGTAFEVCFITASISQYQSSLTKKFQQLMARRNAELQLGIEERTAELKLKNEQLQNSLEEKDNLLNVVVHDLRSPLNQTKALGFLISQEAGESSPVLDMVKRIEQASDNGLRLIEELMTIARLESGKTEICLKPINVMKEIRSTISNFEAIAARKNIMIDFCGDACLCVKTYTPYFIRIVENLLSNAVKFSPARSTVTVSVETGENISVYVADQGPGFSPEDLKRIYRKFQRLSAQPTGGEHSTGLGLYISKLLAEQISTTLSLKSSRGHGTTFCITFDPSCHVESVAEVEAVSMS